MQRIENELYNDKTKQIKFVAKQDPYARLAELLGEKYVEYRKKWVQTSSGEDILKYPLHLDIAINDTCNIKCHFCPHVLPPNERGYKPAGADKISLELFEKIIKDGVKNGLSALSFGPISEPLLVDNLEEYIKTAKNAGVIDLILYTNAHLLSSERAKTLIQAGITWINISIGAATKSTYEAMRDYADFDKVVKNTLDFIKAKKDLKSELPMVRLSFVNTKENHFELEEFIEFWQDKADVVSIQNLVNLHKNTVNSKNFKKEFYIETEADDKTQKFCSQPFQRLLIRNNGDITPCCRFFGLNLVFGNINKDNIYDVYNSENMKEFKKTLNTDKRSCICEKCLEAICGE
jgi:radical SAM protein with 4Fe4S-binding SPASM domain